MKKFVALLHLLTLLFFTGALLGQTSISHLSTVTFPGEHLANLWGYSSGGAEYALVGGFYGTNIVDITDPSNPVTVAIVDGPDSEWREIKTYGSYAYVVSEGGGGVQIIDLSNLPNNTPLNYNYYCNVPSLGNLTKGHALHIDETAGFLYVYGSNISSGKPVVINLQPDPYNPTYAGRFSLLSYAHDGYVQNNMMYAAHVYNGIFSIVNFTNKSAPTLIATQATPGLFTHNTWLSGSTLFTTDEVSNSSLTSYDISNTDNIRQLDRIFSNPGSGVIVHNTYIKDDYAITSWYKDGFTIVDVTRPANMIQVGSFDTYPNGSGTGFEGCWGVYPYFPSGTIITSNIRKQGTDDGELMVFSADYVRACYLEGTVRNIDNNPLSAVKLELLTTTIAETTAANGEYKTGVAQAGAYTLRASKPGYVTALFDLNLSNGVLVTQDITLLEISLPVELTRFQVRTEDYQALLHWETASEENNAGFELQYAPDALTWEPIGFVEGKGSGSQYDFRTKNLAPGVHYFRLKQLDRDGKFKVSDLVSCVIERAGLQLSLQPNVVTDQTTLKIHAALPGDVRVELYSANMQLLGQQWDFSVEKDFEPVLTLPQLPAGKYYLVGYSGVERAATVLIKN